MSTIPLVASTGGNAEASQIIGTLNGVIQNINSNALIGSVAPTSLRNIVIGGDFGTNLWQRGTSFTAIANVTTYTADRFYAIGGASSSISVSKQSMTNLPGFTQKLRFGRAAANADTAAIKLNYIVEAIDVHQMQGQVVVLSFWAQAGANYSAASSKLGITMTTGTTADEGNSAYNGGTWTGSAAVTLTGSAGTTVTGVTLTTAWQRFAVAGVIPTGALEVGFTLSETPVGTAGASDFFEIAGVQLEVVPQGGANPTPFERRPQQLETLLQQRYTLFLNEPGSATAQGVAQFAGTGLMQTTAIAQVPVQFPVTMRTTPTLTCPAANVGTWQLKAGIGTNSTTPAITQFNTTLSPNNVMLQITGNAVFSAGTPAILMGNGSSSNAIQLSAEL